MSSAPPETHDDATLGMSFDDDVLTLTIGGRLDGGSLPAIWRAAMAEVERRCPRELVVDAAGLTYCDGAGASLLSRLEQRMAGAFTLRGLSPELRQIADLFRVDRLAPLPDERADSLVEQVGGNAAAVLDALRAQVAFLGELCLAFLAALRRPASVRWRDALLIAERAGVDALPIICIIGFLLGLILAFQSALPMQEFGAEIYVADLLALSMLKELGPLMTAIILAGRSGSAFAAELGTMKVNEELDALTTMGLDPVRFLAVTRILAAVAMTPLLAVFCSLCALVGGAVVILSLGYPLVTYVDHVVGAVTVTTFLAGLSKSVVFAVLVAGIGCLCGLRTGKGASAVGQSATAAVVSGIVLIAVADAVFAVLLYALKI